MAGANPRKPPLPLPQPRIAAAGKRRRGAWEDEVDEPPHLQVGDEVEVLIRRKQNGLGDSWHPATVCRLVTERSYEVVLRGQEEEPAGKTPKLYQVGWEKIRPAAVAERFSPGTRLEPRAAVEAFYLGAWSRGEIVRRVENSDDRYLVKVGSKRRMETTDAENMELKDLRPPSNKKQGSLRKLSNSQATKVMSDDDEHSNDPEDSSTEKATGDPQLLPMLLIQGPEHSSMVVDQPFLSKSPSSSFLLSGYSAAQHKGVLPESQRVKTHSKEAIIGNNDFSNNVSGPVIHTSSRRKVVTNLRGLRRKQAGFKKQCSQQSSLDGSAVLHSFNSIIESVIIKAPIEDSDASFEERNLLFSKMKANLEYAQSSHHRMTEQKSEYTKYEEEKDAVEAQKEDYRNSLSQMNSSLEENDASMAEHQQRFEQLHQEMLQVAQKIEQCRQKGQKLERDIEPVESELKRLDEVGSGIKKAQDKCKHNISSIVDEVRQTLHNA